MVKTKTIYVCQNCGTQSPRWMGKCPSCESWNSFVEENMAPVTPGQRPTELMDKTSVRLQDVPAERKARAMTGIVEFDRVLGGGIVNGSVTLVGGDPGIGKSTLMLQVVCQLSAKGYKVLYVSGEESVQQTKMRSERLQADKENLFILNQVDLFVIREEIKQLNPDAVVIDSIQVLYLPDISSSPGSVSQVRECSSVLMHLAKSRGISVFIIGHVTKEGMLAGPRVMEHIVDTVLYLEGERYTSYRILRGTKNRFGSTNEMGVFEMTAQGLQEVSNPSEIFLLERPLNASGSVVVPILEGTRPFLVEIQGLVSRSTFGIIRQKAQGFDANRLALLVAVLEKRLELNLQDKDIFLNVVGGVRIMDPAADLGVVLAVASAFLDRTVPYDTVILGEVGLSSEVRSVSQIGLRLNEAAKLGFKRCLVPRKNMNGRQDIQTDALKIITVESVREALEWVKDH